MIAGGIVVLSAMILFFADDRGQDLAVSPTPELSDPTPTPSSSAVPVQTPRPTKKINPTPGIIVKELLGYPQLTEIMKEEGTWFALAPDCNSIVPSNVAYYNETQVMLDNTASNQRRILKIGGREYLLEAGEWYLTVLSSTSLPITLPIYCGSMELGSIDLVARP